MSKNTLQIGKYILKHQPTVLTFNYLQMINSPLLSVNGDITGSNEFSLSDVAKTVYVICEGATAVSPIFGVTERLNRLRREEGLARQSPEFYRVYLDKLDEINQPFANLERQALLFFESEIKDDDIQKICEQAVEILNRILDGSS